MSAIYYLKSKIAYDDPIVLKVIEYLDEGKNKKEWCCGWYEIIYK